MKKRIIKVLLAVMVVGVMASGWGCVPSTTNTFDILTRIIGISVSDYGLNLCLSDFPHCNGWVRWNKPHLSANVSLGDMVIVTLYDCPQAWDDRYIVKAIKHYITSNTTPAGEITGYK